MSIVQRSTTNRPKVSQHQDSGGQQFGERDTVRDNPKPDAMFDKTPNIFENISHIYGPFEQQLATLTALSLLGSGGGGTNNDVGEKSQISVASMHSSSTSSQSHSDIVRTSACLPIVCSASTSPVSQSQHLSSYQRRNYKNLTRERRSEANARERNRVHTIGTAFDSLRRAVPAYSSSQRLSKLAVLRIAARYIESLTCLTDPRMESEFPNAAGQLSTTIASESKVRRL